jgi:hypothetical protein
MAFQALMPIFSLGPCNNKYENCLAISLVTFPRTGYACIAVPKQATFLSMYSYKGSLNAGMRNANLRASPGSTGPECGTHQVPHSTPASSAQPGCLGIQAGCWTGGSSATTYGKTLQVPRWQRNPTLELSKLAVIGLIMLSGILL